MTDLINQEPAATNSLEEVEAVEPQTLEQLTISIEKLQANRDQILNEKRAITTARSELQSLLDEANQEKSDLKKRYEQSLINQGKEKLMSYVGIMPSSNEFINYHIESKGLVSLINDEVVYKNERGGVVTLEELKESMCQSQQLKAHIRAEITTYGGGLIGGNTGHNSGSSSPTKKNNQSSQFGLK